MSATFSAALRELAEPRPGGDMVKRAIGRAAKLAGLSYTRAFDVWYGKARRIDAHEAQQIEQALQSKREKDARNEIQDIRTRLLKVESRIVSESSDSSGRMVREAGREFHRYSGGDRAVAPVKTRTKSTDAGRGR